VGRPAARPGGLRHGRGPPAAGRARKTNRASKLLLARLLYTGRLRLNPVWLTCETGPAASQKIIQVKSHRLFQPPGFIPNSNLIGAVLRIETIHTVEDWAALQPEWQSLLEGTHHNTPFLTYAFQRAWW